MSPGWELLPDLPSLFVSGEWIISEQRPTVMDLKAWLGVPQDTQMHQRKIKQLRCWKRKKATYQSDCRRFWERKVRKIPKLIVLERDCQKNRRFWEVQSRIESQSEVCER